MIRLTNIGKNYGEFRALDGISFELEENKVVGLLGPNGAGKTTLMRIIVGFLKNSEGSIKVGKKKIDTSDTDYRNKIGYLPESNPLYPAYTAYEYLKFVAELKGIKKDEIEDEIRKRAKDCGIKEVIAKKIETLSKGYKQRVGLAGALLGDPKLLILDEPTSGLDPNQIVEIRKLIRTLAKNKTILISTHILPEAKEVCSRLMIISKGKIVLDAPTKSIKNLEKEFIQLTS